MHEDEWWNEWTRESNDARDRAKRRMRIGQTVVGAITVVILGAAALVWFLTR